ncbi:unnamed protein product [Paramecium sonneborni]|uniref:Uncharacterized protein n=1 Tax=Paramecium sonneborni TaxID=65129 RepID=A0A8S1PRQ2_9CILI|nr:unnamed protein product [Paramecium sonneborni]
MQDAKDNEEFVQNEQEFKYISEQVKQKLRKGEYNTDDYYKRNVDDLKKCIKMMETEASMISNNSKKILQNKILQYKKQLDVIEENINELLIKQKKTDNLKGNLFENDLIIEEIDRLTQDTEQIALNVDQKMNAGTLALQQTKFKKQDLKSNIRKSEFTISMMNNQITMDKRSLWAIVILLGIIDLYAIYKKVILLTEMQQESQNKKITFKFLNQLKLMIKPSQKIIQITHALVTILSGTIASIQGNQIKPDWQSIKYNIRNTNEILEIINDPQTFQKRVRFENLEKSMLIFQSIQQQNQDEQNDETFQLIQETYNSLLAIAKPLFKNLLLCRKTNQRNRSLSQNGFQKIDKLQQSQQSFTNKSNISQQQLNNSHTKINNRPRSQQSNLTLSRSSSNSKDYQKRVIEAQIKKQSRLDKILKLQTNKPSAKSQIKQMIDGQQSLNRSYRSNSKESLMRQEIEKNQQKIKKMKQQENAIKWEIERESKRIRENEIVNQIQDEIYRYKISWENDQKIKQEKRKSIAKQNSLKKQNYTNNETQRSNSINYDENKGNSLKQDLLLTEKLKSEKEQSLNKILKTINNSKQKQQQQLK